MNNSQQDTPKANIVIVDDVPANLRLLAGILKKQGYEIRPIPNGKLALKAINAAPPDLILLDINMPDLNGYDVCRQLKANEKTRDIPVIFISALDETLDKIEAFSVGGVDYITKPFQFKEVLARISAHLTIRDLQQHLKEQVVELDAFAHTVAHDLNNPLTGIITSLNVLEQDTSMFDEHTRQLIQVCSISGRKMRNIIDELLLLASVRKSEIRRTSLNMAYIINQAQNRLLHLVEQYQAEIIIADQWPSALGYAPWIEEVWANYLSNGMKYGGQPPRLELGAMPQPNGMIRFWVKDNGPGLTPEAQASLFTEFTRLNKIRAQGHGLGLSIVRRIMDKLEGRVGVESTPGQGSEFYFTLPKATT